MDLIPYLDFYGEANEAIDFYKKVFNGEIVYIQHYSDAPDMDVKEDMNKVLHAQFKFGDNILYIADVFSDKPKQVGSRIALTVNFDDPDEQRRVYDLLVEDGVIEMVLENQFWGSIFGSVTDKFGIPWNLDCVVQKDFN